MLSRDELVELVTDLTAYISMEFEGPLPGTYERMTELWDRFDNEELRR